MEHIFFCTCHDNSINYVCSCAITLALHLDESYRAISSIMPRAAKAVLLEIKMKSGRPKLAVLALQRQPGAFYNLRDQVGESECVIVPSFTE